MMITVIKIITVQTVGCSLRNSTVKKLKALKTKKTPDTKYQKVPERTIHFFKPFYQCF